MSIKKGVRLILYSYWWLRNFVDKRAYEKFSDMSCVTTKAILKEKFITCCGSHILSDEGDRLNQDFEFHTKLKS